MQGAPNGAHYVWVNNSLSYPKALAAKLGRDDLIIVSPNFFRSDRWLGIEIKGIVLDHATDLGSSGDGLWENYRRACERIRP